jgi:mRNA interferase MazF
MTRPSRGEVWRVNLEPVQGHEQEPTRPALVVSDDWSNHSASGLVTILPMTTKARPVRSFLRVDPPEGGVSKTSFIICDQVRTISIDRLSRRFGVVSPATLATVEQRLKYLLGL